MLTVGKPGLDAKETYLRCISSVRDADLRGRLRAVAPEVVDAAAGYASRAAAGELHLVPTSDGVAGVVSRQEMADVYERRMSRQGSPGRALYDAIRGLPQGGTCPLCAHRDVSTLDHVLPKSLFCQLAVAPDNLVGACKDCNHAKSSTAPTSAGDAPLHPYFDDISGERWLGAQVVEGVVAAVLFHVVPVDAWSDQLNQRIRRQFDALDLAELYSIQAARVISGHRVNMARIFDACGAAGVAQDLRHQQHSWESVTLNSWQAVTFGAMSQNPWYCSGGFRAE